MRENTETGIAQAAEEKQITESHMREKLILRVGATSKQLRSLPQDAVPGVLSEQAQARKILEMFKHCIVYCIAYCKCERRIELNSDTCTIDCPVTSTPAEIHMRQCRKNTMAIQLRSIWCCSRPPGNATQID